MTCEAAGIQKRRKNSSSVREGGTQLVSQRRAGSPNICVYIQERFLACVCAASVVTSDCREKGEREGLAVNAVSTAGGLAAEQ